MAVTAASTDLLSFFSALVMMHLAAFG
jgi:hypothetical protein